MLNYLDLFSGIGGFHLGLLMAGFKFDWVGYSDNYEYANKIYKKRFPDAIELGDITKINPYKLPRIDLITAGFPCQDISVAGKREGIKGERSGLFYEITRIAGVVRPRIILLENVPNLLSGESGEWMRCVLTALTEIGYDAEWQVISARFVGARHLRKRVWIIAYPECNRRNGKGISVWKGQKENLVSATLRKDDSDSKFNGRNETGKGRRPETLGAKKNKVSGEENKLSSSIEYLGSDVPDSERNRGTEGSSIGCEDFKKRGKIPKEQKPDSDNTGQVCENVSDTKRTGFKGLFERQGKKQFRGRNKSRSEGFWDYWTVEPELGRVAHGIPNRVDRLKCIGAAVVRQVVAYIGKFIINSGMLE